jgi:GNAT superfamily N-acetyltransferase
MEIRTLAPGDEALLNAAVVMIDEDELTPEKAKARLADPMMVCIAAIVDGEPIGFIYGYELRRFEAVSFFVYAVDVREDWRQKGVAKAMFDEVRRQAWKRGWDEGFVFTNQSNPAALALYGSVGGVRPPPDDVVMFDFAYN